MSATNLTLDLDKKRRGHYSKKVGGIEISITNATEETGIKSDWQLIITDDANENEEWVILNEFFPTKRAATQFAVEWVVNN
jgi:hypothetical protein